MVPYATLAAEAAELGSAGTWWLPATLIVSGVGAYLGAYLRRKGENRALQEDVARTTKLVKEVEQTYAVQLEQLAQQNRELIARLEGRNVLRMAAVERRLAAHQEAYALWWELHGSVHNKDKSIMAVMAAQEWWPRNCLYLDAEARQAFISSYHAVALHRDLKAARDLPALKENWQVIRAAGPALVRCAQLPPLAEDEPSLPE